MSKLSFSGVKHGERYSEVNIVVDIVNDWFEITHTKELSQVINKSTGELIIVKRKTLKFEVVA